MANLSIEEFKECLGKTTLTDQQIEQLRDTLYAIAENVIDDQYDRMQQLCKKHSFTAE